jgi:hypothetical protein
LRAFIAADVRFLIVGAYQMGLPPDRINVLTELTGLTFAEAWPDRIRRPFGEIEVDFIGRASFIRNKRSTGRPQGFRRHRRLE